jgi:serine/threonine-protein kinase
VDGRSDQYALAATCYEMLAGVTPFTGLTAAALIAQRFSTPTPSVRSSRPEVPEAADRALRRALALNQDDRFPSVDAFVAALGYNAASPDEGPESALATVAVVATVVLGLLPHIM